MELTQSEIESKAQSAIKIALAMTDASADEAKEVLDGAYQSADPELVLRDPAGFVEETLWLLRGGAEDDWYEIDEEN